MTEPREPEDGDVDLTGREARPTVLTSIEDAEAEPVVDKKPRSARSAVLLSARLVAGLVGVGVAIIALGVTVFVPLPTVSAAPPSAPIVPVSAQQERVCAGPLLRLGDDSGAQATTASSLGSPTITDAVSDGRVSVSEPEQSDAADGSTVKILSAPANADGVQPQFAASQSQSVDRGDFLGTAAAECIEASDEQWLVGGDTTTGRTTLLTIVNPEAVSATVDVTVFSAEGAIESPGATNIIVAPHAERIFSLAGFAPGVADPVVRVQSEGALVVATLQQSTVRTLEPGGVDFVTAGHAPASDLVIPGVVLGDPEQLEATIVGSGYLDLPPALRLFVPGEKSGHATVTIAEERIIDPVTGDAIEGSAARSVDIDVTLQAGMVSELPLEGFEAGSHVVSIAADVPLVAGARVSTIGTDGVNDFAWLPSSVAVRDTALVPVAEGDSAFVNLVNPGADDAEVEILAEGEDSEPISVTVRAGGAVRVEVEPDTVLQLAGFDSLHASVTLLGDGSIAAHTVSPRGPTSGPITIYP